MSNEKTNKKEAPLTVGDIVIIRSDQFELTRETYRTRIGLLCVVLESQSGQSIQGKVLFAGTLATVDLAHVQKMNY